MTLQDFFNDKGLLNEVKNYLDSFLEQEAVRLLFEAERKPADDDLLKALSLTKVHLDSAFDNLSIVFQEKTKEKVMHNPAR